MFNKSTHDVVSTSIRRLYDIATSYRRLIDVETTLYVYWKIGNDKSDLNKEYGSKQV